MTQQFISGFHSGVQWAIAALEYGTPKTEIFAQALEVLERLGVASDEQFAVTIDAYATGRDIADRRRE